MKSGLESTTCKCNGRNWNAAALILTLFVATDAPATESGYPLPVAKPIQTQDSSVGNRQEPAFFKIATGSTAGTYFAVGERLAALVSHPPGAERCQPIERCGPKGMLAVALDSTGAIRNIVAANKGDVHSGLAPADLVNSAWIGAGPFTDAGPQTNIRAIGRLYPETLHLLVAKELAVSDLKDLAALRLSFGPDGSGSHAYAEMLMAVTGRRQAEIFELDLYDAADWLTTGELDAFFHLGGAPVPFIKDLLATDKASLVAIRGEPVAQLYSDRPYIKPYLIAAGTYPRTPLTETIGTDAVWIVNADVSAQRVYEITRSLWQEDNQADLLSDDQALRWYEAGLAQENLPIPLHDGALRFYRENQPQNENEPAEDTESDSAGPDEELPPEFQSAPEGSGPLPGR